jgi:hypothetical protein
MADVVTHLCSGLLGEAASPAGPLRRWAPVFVAGTVLPDLLSRAPATLLGLVHSHLQPLHPMLLYCWNPLHLPMGILLYSLLLALLFPASQRRPALGALLAGGALHVAIDLGQRHVGLGYPLLVPFSSRDFELGLMSSEATVPWAPWIAAATLVLWGLARWRRRPSPPREEDEG